MTERKMKNNGRSQHRFKDNQAEKIFAREWDFQNVNTFNDSLDGKQTLDYLLAEVPNFPNGEVTERDREVAATVVQWLGSPVGQNWLERVQQKVDFKKKVRKQFQNRKRK